ncbi:glycosyltransferase [Microbacter margulisiae]|uniref:Cellulose synthase/poly-beta-1,6-N-acetylglucosamine synthase-like glycosyltransferase n=1 Tax=Microbacter margulisiae TaxID=1350067 RepID=A0A7W5DNX7_9PORP|nr:glycosyltransferase [Microbacter margulisiae]MBB3186341.1 cellulose synthase/poly-beta-1,6-N-acetylglucosamine synthase-like glycosyltransferase [Microbacter margulisiae]
MNFLLPEQWQLPDKILLTALVITFGVQLYYYLYHFNSVLRYKRNLRKGIVPFLETTPPVSVIICAKNESEHLREFLPSVLEQDYPQYEVIVINDGSTDATEELLREMSKQYPHLYRTFVPDSANVISTKKLGITIGIKAAKYDLLLFTDADCKPTDKQWIRNMSRNFTQGTELVIGYGGYQKSKTLLGQLISFDTLFIGLESLGFALTGHPYMGVGRNMAYRKETFLREKGFSKFLKLQSGDDDLFVNRIANEYNTRVEISPESVTWSVPKATFNGWFRQKERHLSTSRFYTMRSLTMLGVEVLTRGLFYLLLLAILLFSPSLLKMIAFALFLCRYGIQLWTVNKIAKQWDEQRFYITLVLFDMFLPLVNLYIHLFGKKGNYQWK